ncbi:MAG: hypothetical protein A2V70_17080 [Planctomycetes bacterium RBG_13_63_9]|nr:MAG: hypothetical protein A2V70_17080 [Planctomycetes bacterium RBG_13_63_9]
MCLGMLKTRGKREQVPFASTTRDRPSVSVRLRTHWPCLLLLCLGWLSSALAAAALAAEPEAGNDVDERTAEAADPASQVPEPDPAEKLSIEQQQILEKFRHFERVLLRMAELSEATDPRRAALLKRAAQQSGDQRIGMQFERLVELLQKDQLARAIESQADLDEDLAALLELMLSENRAKRIEAEKARIRDYLKRLGRIIRRQRDLQGRTEGSPNPKGLAGEQGQLEDTTGDLAKDIRQNEEGESNGKGSGKDEGKENGKPQQQGKEPAEGRERRAEGGEQDAEGKGAGQGEKPAEAPSQGGQQQQPPDQEENPARKRLEAAAERMREAEEKLKQAERSGAAEKQEEALSELQQAKAELEEILRQLREEEIVRMLARLEARFLEMLQLQRQVYEGTVRLDKVPEDQRTHDTAVQAGRLSARQSEIVLMADGVLLLLRDDGTALAFPEAVAQMRQDMHQVALRLGQTKTGQVTQAIEEDILAALEEMIEALKKAQKDNENRQQNRPPPPSEPQDPPLIDVLAEVRMIRALQMRVNRRTQRYSKLIEGEQADKPDLVEALQRLAEREARIHQVTRDLAAGRNQ